jgi:ubiquinone/menaquinone biosynthesis C-methylase UbiE
MHDSQKFDLYIQLCQNFIPNDYLILDCGCGTGLSSYLLAQSDFRVIGMDISPLFLSEGLKTYGKKILGFCVGDATKMPFPDQSFDAVCSYDLLEHVVDVKTVLNEMGRVVKTNGVIIIITANHLDPIEHLKVFLRYSKKTIHKPWEARNRFNTLHKFIWSLFLMISKLLSLNKKIYYLAPVLQDDKDTCGMDFDATWLANRFDIENILKELGFSIKEVFLTFDKGERLSRINSKFMPRIFMSFYKKMRSRTIVIGVKR